MVIKELHDTMRPKVIKALINSFAQTRVHGT